MNKLILFLSLLIFIILSKVDGYTNYVSYEDDYQNLNILCPKDYNKMYNDLLKTKRNIQPFGYTKNEFIDKTRFLKTDIPLPTNADFFYY